MVNRESDHTIVLGDGRADHVGKGVTELCSPQRKHGPDMEGRANMRTSLWGIAEKAESDKKYRFENLYSLLNEANLKTSSFELKRNAAPGVDRIDFKEYRKNLDSNIRDLVKRLKERKYRAKLVRRKYIPKSPGKFRPLGIPAIEDKLVQLAVAKILNAIYEEDFLNCSFGYRPQIGPRNAVQELTFNLQYGSFGWIVEADIKGFFDNINHDWLLKMLKERINDRSLLQLIKKWLKAGILETDGKVVHPASGTPQGGIVSPILANIYLHYALDLWFEKRTKANCRGMTMIVRYADDFVCAFQYKEDADKFYRQLSDRLGKFSLEVAPEKTRILRFSRFNLVKNEGFVFLGFEFRWKLNYKGKPQVKRRTAPKKLKASINNFKEWIKENRNMKISLLFKTLKSKYQGYWNYYGIHDNCKSQGSFFYHTTRLLLKWLNRRSQRKSYNWKGFRELMKHFAIPGPRITEKPAKPRLNFLWAKASA